MDNTIIIIEGVNGSGKTTLMNWIKNELKGIKNVKFYKFPINYSNSKWQDYYNEFFNVLEENRDFKGYIFIDRYELSTMIYNNPPFKKLILPYDKLHIIKKPLDEVIGNLKARDGGIDEEKIKKLWKKYNKMEGNLDYEGLFHLIKKIKTNWAE